MEALLAGQLSPQSCYVLPYMLPAVRQGRGIRMLVLQISRRPRVRRTMGLSCTYIKVTRMPCLPLDVRLHVGQDASWTEEGSPLAHPPHQFVVLVSLPCENRNTIAPQLLFSVCPRTSAHPFTWMLLWCARAHVAAVRRMSRYAAISAFDGVKLA